MCFLMTTFQEYPHKNLSNFLSFLQKMSNKSYRQKGILLSLLGERNMPKHKPLEKRSGIKMSENVTLSFRTKKDLRDALQQISQEEKRSMSSTMEAILYAHVAARKEFKGVRTFYEHLVKYNFPPGLRVLCYNCNLSLGFFGYCPHQKGTSDI